jgi:hypothetical protein
VPAAAHQRSSSAAAPRTARSPAPSARLQQTSECGNSPLAAIAATHSGLLLPQAVLSLLLLLLTQWCAAAHTTRRPSAGAVATAVTGAPTAVGA